MCHLHKIWENTRQNWWVPSITETTLYIAVGQRRGDKLTLEMGVCPPRFNPEVSLPTFREYQKWEEDLSLPSGSMVVTIMTQDQQRWRRRQLRQP